MATTPAKRTHTHAQSMVEFALLLPVFVLVTFAIFEFGHAFYIYNAIANAAREGTRYGVIAPTDTNGIKDRAVNNAVGVNITRSDVTATTITSGSCVLDTPITVTVRYTFSAVVAMEPSFVMNRSASMRIEQCP